MRSILPALTLPLLLAACGGGGSTPGGSTPPPTPPPTTSICPQTTRLAAQTTAVPAAAAWTPGAADWSQPHVPGRILVSSVPGGPKLSTLTAQAQEILPGVAIISAPVGQESTVAATLRAQGVTTQPDFLYQPLAIPNDPGVPGGGHTGVSIGGARYFQTYLTRIKAPEAWEFLQQCGKTPQGALTAILDSKVEATHGDLAGRISQQVSVLDQGAVSDTRSGHGTASAGLVGATTNNNLGVAGVTWSGPLLAVEVLGTGGGSTSALAQGLRASVDRGAQVINMSLGLAGDPGDKILFQALTDVAKTAVLVASAGNTATDGVYFPASHPDVIAVGAVGSNDTQLACYSARPNATRPRPLDLAAPGGTGSCPDATNAGQLLTLAPGNQYTLSAGTSFSAPLVAGAAALMRAANPGLTATEIRTRLIASSRAINADIRLLDVDAAVRSILK